MAAEKKDKPAQDHRGRSWQVLEAERQRRLVEASERLEGAILGAWRPKLVARYGQRGA